MNRPETLAGCAYNPTPLPIRVLVVDDDPAMRQLLATYLGEHDVLVATAAGRQEMAAQLRVGEPHLVILDLRLG
ncbi:response regulator, partial [Methylobacterium oryzisoli]